MGEHTQYELPYEEQPDDEWMRCPWAGDPEASERKKGDYAKKCPCPNCRHHSFTDDPDRNIGRIKRLFYWATGRDPAFCRTCSVHNNCTREDGDCGWRGRVVGFKLTDDGDLEIKYHDRDEHGEFDTDRGDK